MVDKGTLILSQMKEASDELTAIRARSHGAARSKRKRLRKQAAETQGKIITLISDLLEVQRSERSGA